MFKKPCKPVVCTIAGIVSIVTIPLNSVSPVKAQPAGCGSGSTYYLARVGTPISSRQFHRACVEHDACYDTYGKSKDECDRAFHNRMLGICARDHNTILGRPLRIRCNGFADAYYGAVRRWGGTHYRDAQAAAQRRLGR